MNPTRRTAFPLPGATLGNPVAFEHGISYTLTLSPLQTLGDVQRLLPRISSALNIPLDRLIVEPHPDFRDKPRNLRLQVVTESPIEDTVYYDKPRHENGRVLLGPHADGIGEAFLRIYTKNRMHNSFLLGSTGSGKSRLIESVAVTVRDPGFPPTVVFYIDGQDGISSPFLFKHATWPVGMDGVGAMLSALERIARWRGKENSVNDWQGFTPTLERPGIMVIVDECHVPFALFPERFANGARKWNKVGISIHAASQDSNVTETFGGKDILRSSLCSGTGLVMRVTSNIAGNLMPGLDLDPTELPVLPGYGVMVVPPGGEGRTAGFRGRYAPDEDDREEAWERGEALPVPTINEWFTRYPPLELDKGAARAAGLDYLDRKEIAARRVAEEAADVALLNEISDEEYILAQRSRTGAKAAGTTPVTSAPARASHTRISVWGKPPSSASEPTTVRQAILSLAWDAPATRGQVIDGLRSCGHAFSDSAIDKALMELKADGKLLQDEPRKPYRRA